MGILSAIGAIAFAVAIAMAVHYAVKPSCFGSYPDVPSEQKMVCMECDKRQACYLAGKG